MTETERRRHRAASPSLLTHPGTSSPCSWVQWPLRIWPYISVQETQLVDIVSPDTNPPAGKQEVLGCRGPHVMRGFSGHQGALGTPARGQVTKGHLGHQGELRTQGGAQDPPWGAQVTSSCSGQSHALSRSPDMLRSITTWCHSRHQRVLRTTQHRNQLLSPCMGAYVLH